ncbi:MAG: hypothetical protein M0D57_19675 [Sphingobacteriales bacterium JAD_PAG50586_3]|nr:MAG: hypothetical protein M0D57_19675 [Sphingobacteriales bacterium JAD_PAG50586_3]
MKLHALLLLTILAIFTSCNGQPPTPPPPPPMAAVGDTVTSSQMGDSILVIYQAKDNTYWFGTHGRGVYKYDGNTIIRFNIDNGLSNNYVRDIKEDNAGNIYISNFNGINKYDGKTITNPDVAYPDGDWKLAPGDLWFANELSVGKPYRYNGNGFYQLSFPKNSKEDAYHKMFPYVTFSPYGIYTTYTDSKGRIWFGTAALGVGCYDGKAFTWINEDDLTEIHNGPSNGIRSIKEDKDGVFWFSNTFYKYTITQNATGGITYKREKGLDIPKSYGISGFEYMSATVDDSGNFWIVTYSDGVWKYDGKNITRYPIQNAKGNVTLYSIYKDRQGTLWLGTHTDGVYKFNGEGFEKVKL